MISANALRAVKNLNKTRQCISKLFLFDGSVSSNHGVAYNYINFIEDKGCSLKIKLASTHLEWSAAERSLPVTPCMSVMI